MKVYVLLFLLAVVVIVECGHTFLGTSVQRKLIYHKDVKYPSKLFQKRIENVNYTIPYASRQYSPSIQGILAYDLTTSGASANVTKGGLGYNFVNLRLKSDRAEELHFDIYIYV
ncbi:unnamed protein product [Arctia plantaginis]|uniref:MBF2 n=1 Tax=Arctia plantaginis TaxID=874455 RepID=A0A8S1A6F7_ARCPL|nr:unnamed protein product [Arctia plantaginis]CAB3253824.1 unnamed protein product [Arctia plantaginis]